MGFSGGFSDVRLDSNTFQVSFRGNGYTSRQTVETFALYRCAELTAQAGFDTFVIVGGDTQAAQVLWQMPGYYSSTTMVSGTTVGGMTVGTANTWGTYTPGPVIPIRKYEAMIVFKAFKGPKGSAQAFDAREVMSYLGSRVGQTAAIAPPPRATSTEPIPPAAPATTPTSATTPVNSPSAVSSPTGDVLTMPESATRTGRPSSGEVLSRASSRRGQGELSVVNGLSMDAVVSLRAPNADASYITFYVRAGENAAITDIAQGDYELAYTLGESWMDGRFAKPADSVRLTQRLTFADASIVVRGSEGTTVRSVPGEPWKVVLRPNPGVSKGTAKTEPSALAPKR
jgi:hypothetical protein